MASAENFPWGGVTEKTKAENSTIKPSSTLSVTCMKIQGMPRPFPRCRRLCAHNEHAKSLFKKLNNANRL